MPDKSALAGPPAPTPMSPPLAFASDRGVRVCRPLPRILAPLGLQLERPPARLPDCEMRRFAPGSLIAAGPAPRRGCFVVCHGLALRRGPDGTVRPAVAVAGPNEALALDAARAPHHGETLSALTAVEVAIVEAGALAACEASEALMSRIIVGPQSIACIRCWARFGWIGDAQGVERMRRALATLAQRLGDEASLLSEIRFEVDALAAWLAMPLAQAATALASLQAQGLVTVHDAVLRSIDARAAEPGPR